MDTPARTLRPTTQLVYQSTAISRSAHDLSVYARRLLYAASACIKLTDTEIPAVSMRIVDIARTLGLTAEDGKVSGELYNRLWHAADDLIMDVVTVNTGHGWLKYNWATEVQLFENEGRVELTFNNQIKEYLLGLRRNFSVFLLQDLGRLQGKHALRIFELAVANQGFAGVGGNKAGEWFVDLLFSDLRLMLCIAPTEYKATAEFRRRVVDAPVREINAADLGLRIECDYDTFRVGRTLRGVRLKVKQVGREEPRIVNGQSATALDDEMARTIAAYPVRYAELVTQVQAEPMLPGILRMDPENEAYLRLDAELKLAAKPRRGRPKKPS